MSFAIHSVTAIFYGNSLYKGEYMPNETFSRAQKNKNDEFYTQLSDIENELRHYKEYFKNKTVFCNCDDPYESNFFKYFAANFNHLGLKKLIATCYNGSPVSGTQLSLFEKKQEITKIPHKIIITEVKDANKDGAIDLSDVEYLIKNKKNILTKLKGNGDFRSQECIDLLKQADIVVTNPPFSLFREYVAQLVEYNKKFIIIGNDNCRTYKEIFKLIKENKFWCGYNHVKTFMTGNKEKKTFGNVSWYTNIPTTKRHEDLILYKKYTPKEYPKYDNYDAINVDKTADIPYDYNGMMGVPITFLDKHNPNQFEIIGLLNSSDIELAGISATREYNDFKEIRQDGTFTKASGIKTKGNPVLSGKSLKGNYYIHPKSKECVHSTYARILIKRRK